MFKLRNKQNYILSQKYAPSLSSSCFQCIKVVHLLLSLCACNICICFAGFSFKLHIFISVYL